MCKIMIHETELEFDIYDADTFEKYHSAEKSITEAMQKAKEITDEQGFPHYIRTICGEVKKNFDLIFGDGMGNRVCGPKNSLIKCCEAFSILASEVSKQSDAFEHNENINLLANRKA